MKKSALKGLPRGSQEYVVAHAKWQKSRGRRPSERLRSFNNPKRALKCAEYILDVFGTSEEHARLIAGDDDDFDCIDAFVDPEEGPLSCDDALEALENDIFADDVAAADAEVGHY